MIRVDGRFHLFASRWPNTGPTAQGDLSGYRAASEIVRAVSDSPTGPFEFVEVVLAGRGAGFWDSQMCHNPKICRSGSDFVLYYIGSDSPMGRRKIGYAVAKSIVGPWVRMPQPIPLTPDANNPAPLILGDGSVMVAFRDDQLQMHIARADVFNGKYEIVARNIYPNGPLEDPDLRFSDGKFHLIMEDNEGILTGAVRHGGHLVSRDGLIWVPAEPVKAYTHTVEYTDGRTVTFDRRERPEFFDATSDSKGRTEPTHLLTGVKLGGESWCVVQPLASE
jgi:hypothetical protein